MNPFVITLIISIIVEFIKEYKKLLKLKPFYWAGWIMILALGVSAFYANKNNKESDDKITYLDSTNKKLTIKIDSFKTSFNVGLNDVANDMSYKFGRGVERADSNTIKILTDALANKKELSHTIDSLSYKLDSISNRGNLPFLGCPPKDIAEGVVIKQAEDTLTTFITIYNSNDAPAIDVNFVVYLLLEKNGDYFKRKVIFENIHNVSIPKTHWFILPHKDLLSSYNPYKEGYNQYYIIRGSYWDSRHKTKQEVKLDYVYYHIGGYGFAIYTGEEDLLLKLSSAKYLP